MWKGHKTYGLVTVRVLRGFAPGPGPRGKKLSLGRACRDRKSGARHTVWRCPVAIITCVHYLGPPGPSTSQILGTFSRFSEDFLGRDREPYGGSPRVREDPLGTPPSLSAKKVLREPRGGPENLGSRRSWRSKIMNASTIDYRVISK